MEKILLLSEAWESFNQNTVFDNDLEIGTIENLIVKGLISAYSSNSGIQI